MINWGIAQSLTNEDKDMRLNEIHTTGPPNSSSVLTVSRLIP